MLSCTGGGARTKSWLLAPCLYTLALGVRVHMKAGKIQEQNSGPSGLMEPHKTLSPKELYCGARAARAWPLRRQGRWWVRPELAISAPPAPGLGWAALGEPRKGPRPHGLRAGGSGCFLGLFSACVWASSCRKHFCPVTQHRAQPPGSHRGPSEVGGGDQPCGH